MPRFECSSTSRPVEVAARAVIRRGPSGTMRGQGAEKKRVLGGVEAELGDVGSRSRSQRGVVLAGSDTFRCAPSTGRDTGWSTEETGPRSTSPARPVAPRSLGSGTRMVRDAERTSRWQGRFWKRSSRSWVRNSSAHRD